MYAFKCRQSATFFNMLSNITLITEIYENFEINHRSHDETKPDKKDTSYANNK